MKNLFVILLCYVNFFSCKAQSETMNIKLTELFNAVKKKVEVTKWKNISVYKKNYEVLNFRYVEATNEIYWTTIVKEIGGRKPRKIIAYKVSYDNIKIQFEKDNIVFENSNTEYKSIANSFISDVLIFNEYQEEISKEIKKGKIITLKKGEKIKLKEGFSLSLTKFISKHVFVGQPSYARAELIFKLKNSRREKINFSNQFLNGIDYPGDTWLQSSGQLKKYFFRVITFKCDESITLLISKKEID